MGRKVLDTSEVSSAFTMKMKGSHPFFSMGPTLKVLLLERLVRKKNYFDLRVQKMKASRGSLPQQLGELLSWVTFLCLGQDRTGLTLSLIGSRYLRELHYIHSDLSSRLSAALCEKCYHLLSWTGLLNWERHAQTFLRFPANQLQHPSSESDTGSPLEQADMRTAKGAHVNEIPGKGDCQSAKEYSVALQHTNMWVSEVLNSLFAQNQVCNYNQDTNTATGYILDLTYPTKCLETQKNAW